MEINAKAYKIAIINKLHEMNVFFNNNQKYINPDNLAEVMQTIEKISKKVHEAFGKDDELDPLIKRLEEDTARQEELIRQQKASLNFEDNEGTEVDEYKGEIMDV